MMKRDPSATGTIKIFWIIFFFLVLPNPAWAEEYLQAGGIHQSVFKDKWGVEIVAVRISAEGNMVDFRYKVIDAAKAAPLFDRNNKPYLLHQTSSKVLTVPRTAKVGPLRSSDQPKQDRVYWMFFGNQTKLVNVGDKVTVTIGDFKAENLVVQ
jgi:hypothetical protein